MLIDYRFEKYYFFANIHGIIFNRKLDNETAFDGIIKIYSLNTDSNKLNALLCNKFFGDFIYPTETGVFFRLFDHKESWPHTSLIFIDLTSMTLNEVKRTNSSWAMWFGNNQGNGMYSIAISPTENIDYQVG